MRNDAEDIADALERDLESVLNKYWSGYLVVGNKALLTPKINPKSKTKKPTSSFMVDVKGSKRGSWYRFSQGVGGGPTALLFYGERGRVPNSKEDWAEAFQLGREFTGMRPARQSNPAEDRAAEERRRLEQERREERRLQDERDQAEKDAKRTLSATQVWDECVGLEGTLGEKYLIERGIPAIAEWPWQCHDTLRFHPALGYELDWRAGKFPALVGCVRDAFGDVVAVWQVYLDKKLPKKADLENAKVGRGPAAGGAVRIGGNAERIGTAEGMETAIALWVLEGFRKPIWATLSTSGMVSFEPPRKVKHVSIYPDGDSGLVDKNSGNIMEPPGMKAAKKLRSRMKDMDLGCNINEMTMLGDGLDLLNTRNDNEKRLRIGQVGIKTGAPE
jgi:hypothetical protein